MFCLLVVLAKLSLLAKWLARKTPLRKPNRGKGIISIKPRPKSAHDFLGLLYCFIVLLCICVVSCPYVIYYPTVMARYSLFVLKVPLNPKQTNKQTNSSWGQVAHRKNLWQLLLWYCLLVRFPFCHSANSVHALKECNKLMLHWWGEMLHWRWRNIWTAIECNGAIYCTVVTSCCTRPELLLKHSNMRVEAVIFGLEQYDVTTVQQIAPVLEISSPYSFCYLIIRNVHWMVKLLVSIFH